jgi:hypothetical protein
MAMVSHSASIPSTSMRTGCAAHDQLDLELQAAGRHLHCSVAGWG